MFIRFYGRLRLGFLSLVLLFGLCFLAIVAEASLNETKAREFVSDMMDEISTLSEREDLANADYLYEVRKILRKRINTHIVGRLVLGAYGRGLSNDLSAQFVEVLENYVILVYGLQLREHYGGEQIKVLSASASGHRSYMVEAQIIHPDNSNTIQISLRLYQDKKDNIKIIDIIWSGISMVISQRDEFASIIRNNGGEVTALVEQLKATTAEVRHNFINSKNPS